MRLLVAIAVSASLLASATRAEEPTGDAPPHEDSTRATGWEPALALRFGVHSQDQTADVSADFAPIRAEGGNPLRFGFAGFDASLATPPLVESALAPRLFVHVGGELPFSDEHLSSNSVAAFRTSLPGYTTSCPPNPTDEVMGNLTTRFTATSCDLQNISKTIFNYGINAGVGVDITLPFGQRQFRLRPSIDYYAQSLKFEAIAQRKSQGTFVTRNTAIPPPNIVDGGDYENVENVQGSTGNEMLWGFGPRLGLDVEVAKLGPVGMRVYLETAFYWLVSDTKFSYSGTSVDPQGNPISARFETEIDDFIAQGGGGLRLVWKGW